MSITRTDGASGAYFEIGLTGTLTLSDGTNVLSVAPATGWTLPAGATVFADVSAMATGTAKINMKDNVAAGFVFTQGANEFQSFVTTDDAEEVLFSRIVRGAPVSVTTAATAHTLTFGTAGANQTKVTGNVILVSFGTAGDVLRLPVPTGRSGLEFRIYNVGANSGAVATNNGGTTVIATLASAKMGFVGTNGTGWAGGVAS